MSDAFLLSSPATAANAMELDVFIKRDRMSGFGLIIHGGEGPEHPVSTADVNLQSYEGLSCSI